jgi:hypothetical protein
MVLLSQLVEGQGVVGVALAPVLTELQEGRDLLGVWQAEVEGALDLPDALQGAVVQLEPRSLPGVPTAGGQPGHSHDLPDAQQAVVEQKCLWTLEIVKELLVGAPDLGMLQQEEVSVEVEGL